MPLQTRPSASLLYPQPPSTPSLGGGTRRGCLQNPPASGVSSARSGGPPPPRGHTYCALGPVGLLASGKTDSLEEPGMEGQAPGRRTGFGRQRAAGPGVQQGRGGEGQRAQRAERHRPAPWRVPQCPRCRAPRLAPCQQGRGGVGITELPMLRRGGTGSLLPISAAGLGVGERTLQAGRLEAPPRPQGGGSRGGVRGSPRVRLSARAVWANSRPSCGVSISASSADSLLQSRSSASRLPVDTARGSARSWGTGGRSGLPPPTTGSQAHVVPRPPGLPP